LIYFTLNKGTRFSAATLAALVQKHTVRNWRMTVWKWATTASVDSVAA
jgi:hypothetical protein